MFFIGMTKFFVLFCKKGLTARRFCGIIIKLEIGITIQYLGVAQLVARYLGVVEAAGSSPVTQTNFLWKRNKNRVEIVWFQPCFCAF